MKVSKKTLLLMATGGLIISPVIIDQIRLRLELDLPFESEDAAFAPSRSLADRYYEAQYHVRNLAIKYGLLPPPPPCGICGMG